jgi:hypothetical protein
MRTAWWLFEPTTAAPASGSEGPFWLGPLGSLAGAGVRRPTGARGRGTKRRPAPGSRPAESAGGGGDRGQGCAVAAVAGSSSRRGGRRSRDHPRPPRTRRRNFDDLLAAAVESLVEPCADEAGSIVLASSSSPLLAFDCHPFFRFSLCSRSRLIRSEEEDGIDRRSTSC